MHATAVSLCAAPPPFSANPDGVRCAVFCRVIDNYGDAGVCWRLARQLAREYGWQVRLFIDLPDVLRALLPTGTPFADAACDVRSATPEPTPLLSPLATIDGVAILPWPGLHADGTARTDGVSWPQEDDPGAIVIEAFACELPDAVLQAMAVRATPPVWLNLEYLSAEDWVNDCHLMPSRHPRLGLEKTFFFPGMRPGTGGVLRESDLDTRRQRFLQDPVAQTALWQRLGLTAPAADQLIVTLFAYENAALHPLLAAWADASWCDALPGAPIKRGVTVLVPQGRISPWVAQYFQRTHLAAGETLCQGALTVQGIPFVSQDEYDPLLWLADVNFVRGEDSFVRAQWAERPFIWHIYPQDDAAHLPKRDAALERIIAGAELPDAAAAAMRTLWQRWNEDGPASNAAMAPDDTRGWRQAWRDYVGQLPHLQRGSERWAPCLRLPGDLAANLVRLYAEKSTAK